MNEKEIVDIIAHTIPEKDVDIVLDIVEKTIEVMNLQPLMSEDEFMALSDEQRYFELINPRICSFKYNERISGIFIRFVGDETILANVFFFPIEAVWSFLDTARNYFNSSETTLNYDKIEELSVNKAVEMFRIMLKNLYPRVLATMQSITEETINEWYRREYERYREHCSRQGIIVPSNESAIKQIRQNIIKDYVNDVKNIWDGDKKRFENYQKLRLAEEYEKLYEHWDTISLLYRNKKDYLDYAKREGFEDTPDDLLDELKGSHHRGISLKALEHAARRAGLINPDTEDAEILEKRNNGIPTSGFRESALYKYLEEGRKIKDTIISQQPIETTSPEMKQLAE